MTQSFKSCLFVHGQFFINSVYKEQYKAITKIILIELQQVTEINNFRHLDL